MIIVMRKGATQSEIEAVVERVQAVGCQPHPIYGEERTVVAVVGDARPANHHSFESLAGVEKVLRVLHPFKLASRDFQAEPTIIPLNGARIGDRAIVVMAGPCAVEDRTQLLETAWAVKETGCKILRGGAFKPRTSPYSFQGLGEQGLELLAEVREVTGLAIVTEVMAAYDVERVARYADILQIGARNMQNFALLHEAGESGMPVLLKRGMMATLEELLMSAEYILSHGNSRVMLCERGIRTFEKYTRNTLDLSAVPVLKELTHLPVIVDPSHGTGRRGLVAPMGRAAIAAGADGLLIEVHPHPERALSDGAQSITPGDFVHLMAELREVAAAVGRTL